MKKLALLFIICLSCLLSAKALGSTGDWTCSVALDGYVSSETGKAPNAYMWVDEACEEVRFVVLAQQNMTEEALLRDASFRKEMTKLGGALIWVAPWFSQDWAPQSGAQQVFEEMMVGLAGQSGHKELPDVPIVPFGHSAQATFPWNFAAWNPHRTLAIISFHGDAPRTNLCGYGASNVEWGRTRNIDGIPGLMIEGEYEWWEARVRPALAFRMMYPESCISLLCDAGSGHFDISEATIEYIALFIRKACEKRLCPNGTLQPIVPRDGWFYGAPKGGKHEGDTITAFPTVLPGTWDDYEGCKHEAFWYFDEEMARLTHRRYEETDGKQLQHIGAYYKGHPIPRNKQGILELNLTELSVGDLFTLEAVHTDSALFVSQKEKEQSLHIEYICGPLRKLSGTTYEIIPYDFGMDNPRRYNSAWLALVSDANNVKKRTVMPIKINLRLKKE